MLNLFLYLLSSSFCLLCANLIRNSPKKIIDIIHYNLPKIKLPYLSDSLILLQTIFTILVIDMETFDEMLLVMSIVQVLKGFCSVSTVLPPLKNYHDKYRLGGINGTGTEYIFSGHASYSALTTIYLYKYRISPYTLFLYNLISQFLIILTHNHYTVDVLLAWIITPLVYGNVQLYKR